MSVALPSRNRAPATPIGHVTAAPAAVTTLPQGTTPGYCYSLLRILWRIVIFCTMRVRSDGLDHIPAHGGCLLACVHVGHIDPVIISTLVTRKVSWLARIEFFRQRILRGILNVVGAIAVDRTRPGRRPLREALARLRGGLVVGIFPEGEIMRGDQLVCRGGPIKHGVIHLAAHSACPILPVLVLGTDSLSRPGPWLPAKRGRLWILVGKPMYVSASARNRAERHAAAAALTTQFCKLFRDARSLWQLPESILP